MSYAPQAKVPDGNHQTDLLTVNPLMRQVSNILNAPQSMFSSRRKPCVQKKPSISEPGDVFEREADRVAGAVMADQAVHQSDSTSPSVPSVQRKCAACEEEDQIMREPESPNAANQVSAHAGDAINQVSGGQPLSGESKAFFESRMGADFSDVRIHTDTKADTAARSIYARAYTLGSDIVFRKGEFNPHSFEGRHLLAHELTHVIQQGGARQTVQRSVIPEVTTRTSRPFIARACPPGPGPFPGDGLAPPGDCSWGSYIPLRAAVVAAKQITNPLGRCSGTDGCVLLAIKIAAMATEMTSRIALDTTCFRGGNKGHRERVCNLINSIVRCQRFFAGSNCSPELLAAMEAVVQASHAAIMGGMALAAAALVVALIAAIILLIKAILAALAAAAVTAAEAAAIAATAAALIAVLTSLQEAISPSEDDGA
ncbi:eCIS core domain-containing protein [Enterovibrio coralii]|uniref:DUF4157 domain-containing protein n=1 Tax=Enterovibrio coralii TaxID=294935 RepID=A0A135IC39_9GAMM|nr:DUF4157 domain-containing protein [Enterovibrio coralii]KXF83033.1 hypothetical protein ATN88_04680 [Enterovibrio coralii]